MGNYRLAGRDVDLILDAIGFPAEIRHFIELAKAGEATPLSLVADDLVTMPFEGTHLVQLFGCSRVQIDHRSPLHFARPKRGLLSAVPVQSYGHKKRAAAGAWLALATREL